MASASICCWPPERSAAGVVEPACARTGNAVEHLSMRGAASGPVLAEQPAGGPQVLGDGQRREHALAAGHLGDAEGGDRARAARW